MGSAGRCAFCGGPLDPEAEAARPGAALGVAGFATPAAPRPARAGGILGWLGPIAAAALLLLALLAPERSAGALRLPALALLLLSAIGIFVPLRWLGFGGRVAALAALLLAGAALVVARGASTRHDAPEPTDLPTGEATARDHPFDYFGEREGGAVEPPGSDQPVGRRIRPRLFRTHRGSGGVRIAGERFEAAELGYVGFELELPASAGRVGPAECQIERRRTGVRLVPPTTVEVGASGTRIVGLHGADGPAWLPGDYRLLCAGGGIEVEPRDFTIQGRWRGEVGLTLVAPQLRSPEVKPESLRLFHQDEAGSVAPVGGRHYFSTVTGSPHFIAAELGVVLAARSRPLPFTYTCHYFTDEGELIGQEGGRHEIPAGHAEYFMWASWGRADGGYWRTGNHYVECDLDGSYAAAQFFRVERR